MEHVAISALLRRFEPLGSFPDIPFDEMVTAGRLARWKKGHTVLEQGLPRIGAIFVLSGVLSNTGWRKTDEIDFVFPIYPRDSFQLDAWLDTPSNHTTMAVSDVEALVIPVTAYKELLVRFPQLQRALWAASTRNVDLVLSVFAQYVSNSSEERLFAFLRRYMEAFNSPDGETWPWHISQGVLASFLGTSRPHLSTIISRMRTDGILEMTRRKMRVPPGSPVHAPSAQGG
ncbi:MAG: Crp/Fnr family transcriptional regulator [Nitratireductor sp.]